MRTTVNDSAPAISRSSSSTRAVDTGHIIRQYRRGHE
jgi:hypothetical protein